MSLSVVLAGGGTTGHVGPLLALADCLCRRDPATTVTVLGTAEGLEARLVPEAGYPLVVVPKVPMPRRPGLALAQLPGRLRAAVLAAERAVRESGADVVVGFGGYVATPAYLAARRLGVPIVIHEQNARPGLANRLGARFASAITCALPGTPLARVQVVGMPMRQAVTSLDRAALRAEAHGFFGLVPGRPTLLVTGGSLGAQRLNETFGASAADLVAAGGQVLHSSGRGKQVPLAAAGSGGQDGAATVQDHYLVREYLDRMDLAYAAADLVVCRAGAGTVCELSALGLPAIYVPLPIGNGEQRLNAEPVVRAGGGLLVSDAEATPAWVRSQVLPLLTDPERLAAMGQAAAALGIKDGDERLADVVTAAAAGRKR